MHHLLVGKRKFSQTKHLALTQEGLDPALLGSCGEPSTLTAPTWLQAESLLAQERRGESVRVLLEVFSGYGPAQSLAF